MTCIAAAAAVVSAPQAGAVIPESVAQQAGLTRAWFTQAPIDAATQQIHAAVLSDGVIYVLTSAGNVQALDAETGAPKWRRRYGDRLAPVAGPTVEGNRLAIVVGSTAFLIDAETGAQVLAKQLDGAPGGAPAIGEEYLLTPLLGGRLVAHPIDYQAALPFRIASPGTVLGNPVVASGRVVWSTVEGMVYTAAIDSGVPSYRFDAAARLSGAPIVDAEQMYFATTAGFVYAMQTETGRVVWRRAIEGSVEKPLVEVADTIYVTAATPSLHALSRETGQIRWNVEGVSDFAAASEKRVYALAPGGALAVLDRETGEPVASWPAVEPLRAIPNNETDRIYVMSDSGLIQCFHEAGADEPFRHRPSEETEPKADAPAETTPADEPDTTAPEPIPGFGEPPAESPDATDPFGDLAPAEDSGDADADNPFDF